MLNTKFSLKRSNSIGIDIGSKETKIIKLKYNQGQKPKLEFIGRVEINPTKPDFIPKLADFISRNKLSNLHAYACVDDPSLKIRKIELPQMPDADLKEAIKWKMRDVVDGVIDNYIVRSSMLELSSQGAKKITFIGYAIKQETILKMMQTLTKIKLRPTFVEPSIVSLAAAIENYYPSEDQWISGIDLGANKAIMVIMGHGKFYFSRPLPHINLSLQAAPDYNQKIAAEIQNTLDTFSVTFQVEQIHKIFLSGGGADTKGLTEHLTKNIGLETELLNPFTHIEMNAEDENAIQNKWLFSQAVALANMNAYDRKN